MHPINPWRYAVGFFGMSLPINLINSQLAFFYVDRLGVPVTSYAAVMLVYFVIDLFDNPCYGWLSDRTRSRWGRRRPWIVVGAPALGISLMCAFSPPFDGGPALLAWLAVWGILTQTFDSMVSSNYGAVLPEAFPDESSRADANAARQAFQLLAMVLSIALTPVLTGLIGYSGTAILLGILAIGFLLYMAYGVREKLDVLPTTQPPLLESLRAIVSNPKFWTIALASGFYSGGMALVVAAVQFFVKYTLGRPSGEATYLLLAVIATSVVALFGWARAVHRFGALRIWRLALAILVVALGSLLLVGSLVAAIAVGCLVGVGYSGVMATLDLIVARLLDEDTATTGVRRESMFLAAFSFFNHTTGLMQALAFNLAYLWFGFRSGDDPGTRPGDAARFLLAGFPVVLVCLALGVSWLVTFDGARRSRR